MRSKFPIIAAPLCRPALIILNTIFLGCALSVTASAQTSSDAVSQVSAPSPMIEREQRSDANADAEARRAREAVNQFSDQLQSLKTRVVALNNNIRTLEEDLLFPVNTQTTVFVSMDTGKYFDLESVKLKLNDKLVTSHLYSDQELTALENGGVQRLYLANLGTGQHEVTAFFTGKGPMGRAYKRAATAMVSKEKGAAYVELRITDVESKQQPEFSVQQW